MKKLLLITIAFLSLNTNATSWDIRRDNIEIQNLKLKIDRLDNEHYRAMKDLEKDYNKKIETLNKTIFKLRKELSNKCN